MVTIYISIKNFLASPVARFGNCVILGDGLYAKLTCVTSVKTCLEKSMVKP